MFSRRHFSFQLFTLAFVAAMFFPRVLPEGMFPDGLTYASIARNMAEGRGGFWSPYFSSSFWIPFQGNQYEFYGHPTLGMGLLSLLFRAVGDHWFVEKFYCILIWLVSVGLVIRLWQSVGQDKQLWWLPVWTWYMMPVVLWSYPNLVLDNTMAVFSILSALFILKGIKNEKILRGGKTDKFSNISYFIMGGLLLHLAFLTKGPVGLFPLVIPVIYGLFYRNKISLQKTVIQSVIATVICFGTLALWYFYAPAKAFWVKYFNVQLVSSISDNDQTETYTWLDYLYIPKEILVQSVAFLIVGLVFFVFSKVKKTSFYFDNEATKKAAFFIVVGLSGSLPMMISHKASSYFLLPALPFFVVGFCLWLEPTVSIWIEKFQLSKHNSLIINRLVGVLAVSVVLYCVAQIGRVGREQTLIHDVKILMAHPEIIGRGGIPLDGKIAVSDSMMKHFNYHGYFQRYNRWELTKSSDTTAHFFIDEKGVSRPTELDSVVRVWGFKKVNFEGLESFIVYKRGDLVKR